MSEEKPAPSFRKTKTGKWAVMAPLEALEKALADDGTIDVRKKSGDWSSFRVVSLGKPFDVDGTQMCYGYDEEQDVTSGSPNNAAGSANTAKPVQRMAAVSPPPRDNSEPLPEYQGEPEDEWQGGF